MEMEILIVVDENDREIGQIEKMEAHRKGVLHRAVSVCLFDDENRWLIQKRAQAKYHCPGLYANSCCSHPRPGESSLEAASRRIGEELGVHASLSFHSYFIYKTDVSDGLIEHEYDHLFVGRCTTTPQPNLEEVESVVWWTQEEIEEKLQTTPEIFAPWFPFIVERILREPDKII